MDAELFVERQTSVMTEPAKDEPVHVVVKQCNFVVAVSSRTRPLDRAEVACSLVYDEPQRRPVSFINQPPLKYRVAFASPTSFTVDCKVNVLSSQHEDHLFRVRVAVSCDGKPVGETFSHPIRAISKLDRHKKDVLRRRPDGAASPAPAADKKPRAAAPAGHDDVASLLLTNTVLLEHLQERARSPAVTRVEEGFASFFAQCVRERLSRTGLFATVSGLSPRERDSLAEIASVVSVTLREPRAARCPPFDPFPPHLAPRRPLFDRPLFTANPFVP